MNTASATDYVVAGSGAVNGSSTWDNNSDLNTMIETSPGSGVYYLKVQTTLSSGTEVKAAPLEKGSYNRAFADEGQGRTGDWSYGINVGETESYDLYYYLDPTNHIFDVFATPMLRSNIGDSGRGNFNWKYESVSDFTQDDYFNWHYDMPYASLAAENSFFVYTKVNYRSVYTYTEPKTELTLPASITSAVYFNNDRYTWATSTESYSEEHRWFFDKPDYTCDFVRVSLNYSVATQSMSINVVPYIAKTANGTNAGLKLGYSTFGAETDVDLSSLPSGVTAHTATVGAKGIITYNTATELAAGEGVLLTNTTGSNVNLSIPVKASATSNPSNNLVRVADDELAQTTNESGYIYANYILTKNTVPNNNADLGWYLVNDEGCTSLTVGTAYLKVLKETPSSPSRAFFPLWSEEPDGVEAVATDPAVDGQAYNLAGQRVAKTTKGLYIVNGKKVMVK